MLLSFEHVSIVYFQFVNTNLRKSNTLFVEEATGNVLPKSYSALAQEPLAVASKSSTLSMLEIFR